MPETSGTSPYSHSRLPTPPIRTGKGDRSVGELVRHLDQSFPVLFIRLTKGVDGKGIDRVYVNTLRILVQRIQGGEIRDPSHLRRVCIRVLKCLGRHHELLARNRDNPQQPTGPAGEKGNSGGVRLFARDVDVAGVAVTTAGPADHARRNELLAAVRRVARLVGLLHVRAFQAYRRYEFEFGKTHGAYIHLARLAILDEFGRVAKLRSWRSGPDRTTRPDARVVRQVRAIHLRACDRVRETTRQLGYDLPPGV